MEKNFIDLVEEFAKTHRVVLFRFASSNFMELKPEFVISVTQEAKRRIFQVAMGIDTLTPLEQLALEVLKDASEMLNYEFIDKEHPANKELDKVDN